MLQKQMTPFTVHEKKGKRVVHKGKGSTMQDTSGQQPQTMTDGDPMDRMRNQYAKQEAPPASPSTPAQQVLSGEDSGAYLGAG